MDRILVGIEAVLLFNLMWALYTTFSKEKIMIRQGEGPLPSSTYSFIFLRHAVRMLLFVIPFIVIPTGYLYSSGGTVLFLTIFVSTFIVEMVSAIIETVVRTLFFRAMFAKMKDEE